MGDAAKLKLCSMCNKHMSIVMFKKPKSDVPRKRHGWCKICRTRHRKNKKGVVRYFELEEVSVRLDEKFEWYNNCESGDVRILNADEIEELQKHLKPPEFKKRSPVPFY